MRERILYLPIISPGTYHDVALANKQGLRLAFERIGDVFQWDYIASAKADFVAKFREYIETFQPTLIFTQFQGSDWITPADLRAIRQDFGVPIVNWNGDVWEHGLTTPDMLALLHEVDLQLVINASALDVYEREGIRAAFWPFGVEMPNRPLPDVPSYDVLFLGNNYSEKRQQLYTVLRSLPYKVGIYGSGWAQSEGECNYDFTTGYALYSKAKICISDNQFPEALGYLSDRPWQAMAAGCLVFQQYVKHMLKWTHIGSHNYVLWREFNELPSLVDDYIRIYDTPKVGGIRHSAQSHVTKFDTFDDRVSELMKFMREVTHAS
jgi:spore maturation protein CgeB